MRADLNKVLTERPRWGSASRNQKTGIRFKHYDSAREDRYSLPKRGKMLMENRVGGRNRKDFTDKLGPLNRWLNSQVGRNWNKVYSDIKRVFPNSNKQNHHLVNTHLLTSIARNVVVDKSKKRRRVFVYSSFGKCELWSGRIYVDPGTNVLMKYKGRLRS